MDFDALRAQLSLPAGGNEPAVPKLVGSDSFAFVRTVGSRVSPDVQLLELYREAFFNDPLGQGAARPLHFTSGKTTGDQAVLLLARGRVRHGGNTGREFYAPVYPEQASYGWLRGKSDRAIRDHFFCGALWQHLNDQHKGKDPGGLLLKFVSALDGTRRRSSTKSEILDLAIGGQTPSDIEFIADPRLAAARLLALATEYPYIDLPSGQQDPLATRLGLDVLAMAEMEAALPRIQWLDYLKTFLRFSTASWVLAQTRVAVLVHGWCRDCLEGKPPPANGEIVAQISSRNRALFHPVNTGGDELEFHVQRYMRARIELTVMLRLAALLCNTKVDGSRLTLNASGGDRMTIERLLVEMIKLRDVLRRDLEGVQPLQAVLRLAEGYTAWASPRKEGQGKNLYEFLQVIVRLEGTPEDSGYLVTRKRRAIGAGKDRIFPGPLLIRLITALAAKQKRGGRVVGGKLLLADLERHFSEYGLEFSSSAGARPLLIQELSELGLLRGSPDAGDSTEIFVPHQLASFT